MSDDNISFKKEIKNELSKNNVPDFFINPNKTDKILILCYIFIFIFGFALIPLRLWLINNPEWYSLIIGGYTSAILLGAQEKAGNTSYLYVLLSIIGACKFIPIYFYMGKHWGKEFILYATQAMPRINRKIKNLIVNEEEKLKNTGIIMTPLAHLPAMRISEMLTVPIMVLGKAKLSLIFLINIITVLIINYIFFGLGYVYGEEVIKVINIINEYTKWIFIALLSYVFVKLYYDMRKNNSTKNLEESN